MNEKIQEQMKLEGKIKISNFDEIVQKYFKNKYNLSGYFEFYMSNINILMRITKYTI